MIGLIKNIALFFFDIVDQYYHQKKIASFLKKKKFRNKYFF